MIDWWVIKLYLSTLAIVLGGLVILGLLAWLVIYLIRRIGFRPTSGFWESLVGAASALVFVLVAILAPIPRIFSVDTWIQIYLLILTATIPAAIFILSFAAQKSLLPYPLSTFSRATRVKMIILSELLVLLALIIIHLSSSDEWVQRVAQFLCMWASILSVILFWLIFKNVLNQRRILEIGMKIVGETFDSAIGQAEAYQRVKKPQSGDQKIWQTRWLGIFFDNLENTRQLFLKYAENRNTEQNARSLAQVYKATFQKLLNERKVGYTYSVLLDGFIQNLDEIAIATAKNPKIELIKLTSSLLYGLALSAIEGRSSGGLRKILWHYRRIYALASNQKYAEGTMGDIVRTCWYYLRDLCRFHIRLLIEEGITENTEVIIAISESPLIELNNLAKFAVDFSSVRAFGPFVDTIRAVDIYSNPDEEDRFEGRWRRQLAEARGETEEVEVSREEYIREALWRRRNNCFMGLGGWVIERLRDGTIKEEDAKMMLNHIHIPFNDFLDVVFHPLDAPESSRFGWMDWSWKWEEREESPFGYRDVRAGGPPWIHDYFFLEALRNYKNDKPWTKIEYKPPAVIGVKFFREELERELDRLKNEEVFKKLVGMEEDEFKAAVEKVRGYWVNIEQRVLTQEKEWIRDQEFDKDGSKRKLIKGSFSKGFEENTILRKILELNNATIEVEEELLKVSILRLNDLRSSYTEREDVPGLERFWEDLGKESAAGESIYIIQQILKGSPPENFEGTAEEVIGKIETVITEMNQQGLTPQVICLLGWVFGWRSWQAFEGNPHFKKPIEGQEVYPEQKGTFHDVPIVNIWWSKQKPLLLILAPKSIQLKYKKLGQGYKELFEFEFQDWGESEEKAKEVLQKYNGQYPGPKTGEKLTGAEAILEIQQHVFVQIFQSLDVKILDPKGVRFFKVKIEGEEKE